MFESYQLPNKARVILVPQADTQSVTGMIMFPVGSRYESAKLNGVSHYIEHLMFKGTEKRKNTLTLTREIDRLGAEYNAFTGKEYTGYYVKADAEYTATLVDILADMLYNSTFDAKEMEREKNVIGEELRMYNDNPVMSIDSLFESVMFDGPLGWDIGGTPALVNAYKRDEVLKFRDNHYDPANMTIVVAGKITEATRERIAQFFGAKKSRTQKFGTYKPADFGGMAKSDRFKVRQKATDQAQMMLGFPAFGHNDPRQPVAALMNTILGGSMSSRLFIQVRERRGLAYTVRSGVDSFRDTGYAYVRAGLEAKNINKALACIKDELQKLATKEVTPRELADAKTHIRGRITLSLEDSSEQADWYARQAMFMDKIYTPEERLALIEKVTAKQIQALAKQLFRPSQMRLAIIGDIKPEAVNF